MSHTTLKDVQNSVDRAEQVVRDTAQEAGAAMRVAGGHIRDQANDIGGRLSRQADGAAHDMAKRVEQQPLGAVLIAGGIGLLAGALLARR